MPDSIKGIIFDFDGTIYGDWKLWTRLVEETLSGYHLPVTAQQALDKARSLIGAGTFYNISGIAIALAKEKGVEGRDLEIRKQFLERLDLVMDHTGPGDELVRLLSELKSSGVKMGIVTFQRMPRLQHRLEVWKLKDYFGSLVTPDHVEEFKPSPVPFKRAINELGLEPASCLVIGDEVVDMVGAKKAGALAVGLPNGFFTEAELSHAGADHILKSVIDLQALLASFYNGHSVQP